MNRKPIKLCICGNSISKRQNKWCTKCIENGVYNKHHNLEDCKIDSTRKKFIIRERSHKCECCNNTEWLNELIPLELDHIDGNSNNNNQENLKLLCPNCHAKTPFYKGANRGNSKRQIERRQRYADGKTF